MDKSAFLDSLLSDEPPVNISSYSLALWYDAKGNWQKAHAIVQDIPDTAAAAIHAYLHRKEGDVSNADYWYQRANQPRPHGSPEDEWAALVDNFL